MQNSDGKGKHNPRIREKIASLVGDMPETIHPTDTETKIDAVYTSLGLLERHDPEDRLLILDMLGLIPPRDQPRGTAHHKQQRRNQVLKEARAERRQRRKDETGYVNGYSKAKPPEERKKPGPKKGAKYNKKPVYDNGQADTDPFGE